MNPCSFRVAGFDLLVALSKSERSAEKHWLPVAHGFLRATQTRWLSL